MARLKGTTAVLLSPVAVIAICHASARVTGRRWAEWSWIPVILCYWVALASMLAWAGDRATVTRWLGPSQGAVAWRALSLLTGALFVPVFRANVRSIHDAGLIASCLALAAIDPWLEQGYWRGLLIDASRPWPAWLRILYATVAFGLSHPLILGVNVRALAGFPGFLGTCFTGLIWSLVYWKTRSLRWPIFSHVVVDILSLSVLVFLNRATIPQ